jgi:hypothetical protein
VAIARVLAARAGSLAFVILQAFLTFFGNHPKKGNKERSPLWKIS